MKQHPPDFYRCSQCDKQGIELVEREHKYAHQPKGEIVDLYKCSFCGQKVMKMIKRGLALYD
jgi:DNA-directed RNA polymerase subunit RPC12/RpoP